MKNKYVLLNKTDIKLGEYEEIELTAARKDMLKQSLKAKINPRKNKYRKNLIAAIIFLTAASPLILTNEQVWASLLKAGKHIELFFNKPEIDFHGYKQTIDQTATDQNVKMTLNEIMLDDGQLLLSLSVNSKDIDRTALEIDEAAKIKPGELSVTIGEWEFANSSYTLQPDKRKNEDGSWNYLYSFHLDSADHDFQILDELDANKNYPVVVSFHSVEYEKKPSKQESGRYSDSFGEIKGNWSFQTEVNGKNIKQDTDVYTVDQEINLKHEETEGILKIKEVRVSPASIKVKYTFESTNGNSLFTNNIGIKVEDERGRRLTGSGTGEGSDTISKMDEEFSLDREIKKLTITPELFNYDDESTKYFKDKAFEVELKK